MVSAHKQALSALGSMGTDTSSQVSTAQSLSDSFRDGSSDTGKGTSTIQQEEDKRVEKNDKTDEIVK